MVDAVRATTKRFARTKYYAGAEPELERSLVKTTVVNPLPGHMPAPSQPLTGPHEWLNHLLVPQGFDIVIPEASSVTNQLKTYTPNVAALPSPETL